MKRANTIGAYMLYVAAIAIGLAWFQITVRIAFFTVGPLLGALLWMRRWGGEVLGGLLGGVVSYGGFLLGSYAWAFLYNEPRPDLSEFALVSLVQIMMGAVVGVNVGMFVFLAAEVVRARRNQGPAASGGDGGSSATSDA
jgi:hypothetical protein